jgi:S-adenosylmethionine:tRNA ribosyltransferase-isomerase
LGCEREKILSRSGLGAATRFDLDGEVVALHPPKHGGFQSAKAEIERVALHACERELYGVRIAVRSKLVDDGTAGIAESEEFRDFVVSFTGGIVARFSEQPVGESLADFKQVGVSAADHQRERRIFDARAGFENHGVDMAFDMVDADERQVAGKAERLRVGDADQQRAYQAGTFGDRDGGKIVERCAGFFESQANHGDDGAQVLARGKLGNHAAVFAVSGELRGDHGGQDGYAVGDHGGRGFIARSFDAKDFHAYAGLLRCDLDLSQFHYHLPESSIAQEPLEDRAGSRMLVLYRAEQRWEDRAFREFPRFLQRGDCLVLNDSKVFPSRLYGRRVGFSGAIEVLLVQPLSEDAKTWTALVHPGRKMRSREQVVFGELNQDRVEAEVIGRGEYGERTLRFHYEGDLYELLAKIGHVPLPPYIKRADTATDRDRYQTVFARETGSVAAPTAGLHFTGEILEACRKAGAEIAYVTLHVGLGTFQPVRGESLHAERFYVNSLNEAKIRASHRVIAAGTTSVRAVESLYLGKSGETDLFIKPGFTFQRTGAMLTNFHLPESSLLMLVCAFAGRESVLAAYEHAVQAGYRFYSYGDCMLIV